MTSEEIRLLALEHGFTERLQPDGTMDLNAYVYAFACAMFEAGRSAAPAGWRLVPAEPTKEWIERLADRGLRVGKFASSIADVLAAAPKVKP